MHLKAGAELPMLEGEKHEFHLSTVDPVPELAW